MDHRNMHPVIPPTVEDRSVRPDTCEDCGDPLPAGVFGSCVACRLRRLQGGALPVNARCEHCGERRRGTLTWAEAGGEHVLLCHNCAGVAARLRPVPVTGAALRRRLRRDVWTEDERWAHRTGVNLEPPPEVRAVMRDLDDLARRLMQG